MEKFRFTYYGRTIPKAQFIKNIPDNWKENLNEYGEFSWGGYKAVKL